MSDEPCISINIIELGNTTVGKTAYLIRNTENKFRPSLSTVGIDTRKKRIELENGKKSECKIL